MVWKQVADILTALRGLIALAFVWIGYAYGESGLSLVAWLLLLAWVSDGLDGELARRSRRQYHSWLGDNDLQIDMAVAFGLGLYLLEAGIVAPLTAVLYLLIWAAIFARWGLNRSLGMIVQGPIYGRFLWAVLPVFPQMIGWMAAWIVGLIIITWPRLPQQYIPEFLLGIQSLHAPQHRQGRNHHSENQA